MHHTPNDFVLYGGTALALRYGHRMSVDFDFFSNSIFDPEDLYKNIPYLQGATIQRVAANTLTCSLDRGGAVQVSFFGGLELSCVKHPDRILENGVLVASALDVGAAKAKVIIARPAWKDYVDLDALVQHGESLTQILSAAAALYKPPYSTMLSLKAMAFFDDIGQELSDAARKRLLNAVQGVKLEDIKALVAHKELVPPRECGIEL